MSAFEIKIPLKAGPVENVHETLKEYLDAILREAERLLSENLPDWDTVEAAVRAAFDTYVRPLDIPYVPAIFEGRLDDFLCERLVAAVKKVYDRLVAV